MVSDLAILNGRFADGGSGGVLVRDGHIAAIGGFDVPESVSRIDARGALIGPGLIDVGVFAVDGPAFAAGGITRILLMPDQAQPLDNTALILRAAASGKPGVWVHPLAAATRALEGQELAEIGLMRAAGACGAATGRGWIADSGVMYRLLAYAGAQGLRLVAHAEDGGLAADAVMTEGETATRLGLAAAPPQAEALAIARDLLLVEATGAPLHFRQVTTARGLALVRDAKKRGLPVSCGISPAHLLLADSAVTGFRTFGRLSPPLRDEADRRACLDAVADGTIDLICSGHDPQGPEAKRLPFADAEPGMAGAETLLALALVLVRDGLIDLVRLFDLLAGAPARLFGLPGGRLDVGAEADILLVDPDAPWRITSDAMVAAAGNTPFDGLPVQGRVLRTIKGGVTLA
ncbi:dihydroorotase [Sphingomonas nostoxanthinifaciens]|uniref:dihydroorotase n=1 Tax=Sphingomonas nostoxanthinifaciens TaxID=2872652 RepID=UPI001CC1C6A2|nr:dihydroorotase [Sphingomonas nostoxanthinifaciens]UAK24850.1 dihydroorotase [Sphingomonas nostoxanthinifaciens]